MLIQLMVSMFGIAFVHRNLSLLEKADLISTSKLISAFYVLQLPFYFYLYFKELLPFVITYIGIFLITFILFDKINDYFAQKTFEKLHLQLIERLILLLKSGKSPQTSVKNVFENLSSWEKVTFAGFNEIFKIGTGEVSEIFTSSANLQEYFTELAGILRSSSCVADQLIEFRRWLRLYNGLKRKSAQATQATKAQAIVSILIYVVLFFLSHNYLNLKLLTLPVFISLALFVTGQIFIFRLGRGIRWKT